MNCPYCDQNVWSRKPGNVEVCSACGFKRAARPLSSADLSQLYAPHMSQLLMNKTIDDHSAAQRQQAAQLQNSLAARGLIAQLLGY